MTAPARHKYVRGRGNRGSIQRERGTGSGRSRRLIVVAIVAVLVVAAVGAILFGLNSMEFRITRQLSEGSPEIVSATTTRLRRRTG